MTFKLLPSEMLEQEFEPRLWERMSTPDGNLSVDDFDYLLDCYRGDVARATELRNAAKLLIERADSIELKAESVWHKFVDRLRAFTLKAIAEQGGKRRDFVLRKHVVKLRKAQVALELEPSFTENYAETKYVTVKTTYQPDKRAIREALQSGLKLEGASLIEQPDSVSLELGGVE